jgi:signal transduction histidine kinase
MASLPQFPVDREEQQPQPLADSITIPSEMSFAQEVREDRLSILWKVTLFFTILLVWILIVLSGGQRIAVLELLLPTAVLAVGCISAGQFLNRSKFLPAVWTYALGAIAAVGLSMGFGGDFGTHFAPFIFPLLVFVVGLLISVRESLITLVIVFLVALGFPFLMQGEFVVPNTTVFALALTTLATGLSAQVSGELFDIAEWALENYRKERRTTFALFESRQALERSFNRQTALTQQLQEINRELEIARKAEEEAKHFRGQFLANMSHELRTPLNAIIGFSQTMLDFPAMYDGVDLPIQYRQDMNQILSSGKHLLNIINDILDLSKVDAGKLDLEIQPVDLGPVVKGVLSTATGLVGDKADQVALKRELPDPLPMVLGDPLRVRQVLLNLYSNASKFTDSGHIKLIVRTQGSEVVFGVEDTGIGIPETDRATIFEEFRQGTAGRKRGRQGAGLGLAISLQLLRLMNGRMWVESTLGKGSTFFFALPLYVSEVAEEERTPGEPEEKAVAAPEPAGSTAQTAPAAVEAPTLADVPK